MNYIKHHFHIIPAMIILAFTAVYSHFVFAGSSVPSIVQNATNFQATDPKDGVKFTFPGTFKDDASSGYYLDIQKTETGSDPLSNGKYSAQAALGVYGTTAKMADADDYIDQNIALKIKKKGSSSYIGELALDTENNTSFSNGDLINAGYSSWDNNFTVDPGEYTIDLLINREKGDSIDVCMPSFDPDATGPLKPIGNVTCAGQQAQGGNSNSYTLVIGDPIFIKGANNDVAQFNVPLTYTLPAKPTDKSKVTGSLQTVIYKKNELKKVEAVIALDAQNITYNTTSMYSYQWTGLTTGNEYVVYVYDQLTGVKGPYISLKYGNDGKIIATKVSTLPSWTSNVTVAAQGGTNNPQNGGTHNAIPGQQVYTATTIAGITTIFKATPEFVTVAGKDSINVNGFVRYEYYGQTEPSLKANHAGESISTTLYNKAGKNIPGVGKVIPAASLAYNKDIPIDIVIPATITGFSGTTTSFTAADAPLKLKMADPGLGSQSTEFTIKMPGTTNQGNNPQSSNAIARDGTTVIFKMESAVLKTTTDAAGKEVSMLDFKGTIIYENPLSSPTIKVNKLAAELYDDSGTKLRTMNVTFNSITSTTLGISGTFSNITATQIPTTIKIWDKDSDARSDGFEIEQTGGNEEVILNGGYAAQTDVVLGKDGVNSVVFSVEPTYSSSDKKVSGTIKLQYKTKKPGTADANISGGDVSVTLYNKSATALKTLNLGKISPGSVVFDQDSIPATFDFPGVNASDAPFQIKATEKNLLATSKAFSVPDEKVDAPDDDFDAGDEGTPPPTDAQKRTYLFNPLREGLDTIPKIVSVIVKDIVIPVALPLLALAIIWTGFLFVTARGNATKLKDAKEALKWTIIGGLIILGAYVIATALQQTLKDIVQ